MSREHKQHMARLSGIERRSAELHAELAELAAKRADIFAVFADGESVDLPTARRRPKSSAPEIAPVSDLAQRRAQEALRANDHRRRLRS